MIEADAPLRSPEKLANHHNTADFCSGVKVLDKWLKNRALANEAADATRTYVVCSGDRVVGYYALATGAVSHETAIGRVRRNMPDPVPVMVLARLAVDQNWQGKGVGRGLLRDAILRTLQAAEIAGIKAILVHAISQEAKAFYEQFGFQPSPIATMTLMLTLKEIRATFSDQSTQ
ncbi:GNAT family N-acetyltransferase [Pantanalinema rosaneae CENA516]|uniref:GNAT family N-acetyltransferase n=1 Tax=Pantanalinema rosaneae TaxID=1620701 RepID=UPI003D6FB6FF